jgi:hypothetical protein
MSLRIYYSQDPLRPLCFNILKIYMKKINLFLFLINIFKLF